MGVCWFSADLLLHHNSDVYMGRSNSLFQCFQLTERDILSFGPCIHIHSLDCSEELVSNSLAVYNI
jgi:hypothetical protein